MESKTGPSLDNDEEDFTLDESPSKRRAQTLSNRTRKLSMPPVLLKSRSVAPRIEVQKLFKRKNVKRPSNFYQKLSKIEVEEIKLEKVPSEDKKFEINCSSSDLEWQDESAGIMTPACFLKVVKATFSLTQQMLVELTVCFREMRREKLDNAEYYLHCYQEFRETQATLSELVVQQVAVRLGIDSEFIDRNVKYYLEDQNITLAGPEGEKALEEFGEKIDSLPQPKKPVDTATYYNILAYQLEKSQEKTNFERIMKLEVDDDIISDLLLLYMEDLINKEFGVEEEDYLQEVYNAISTNSKVYEEINAQILANFERMLTDSAKN